ncbi:peptide-methionine (S)-S-oxide reductase MsrA [Patulibacter brassicae]|uniref:Peptide methionine sulfoxide reductase MsrA n=1 Tax=Patulibacter brassicae TaxID=1705717 RepID=A0ABU4VGR2_9ACTN|nr:peptide-methionine (S)-S-oxide reductase MsrA [Patulibacter brassicae]MDX8151000.1 peptide-methionine (S)-S-oxide reductase MsrA [Patulibacter brassicae]
MLFRQKATALIDPAETLPGRDQLMPVVDEHPVLGRSIVPPLPEGSAHAFFGMGCFWGAERGFWQTPGVLVTAVGYQGGETPNPTYAEVCSGQTNHTEAVLVAWDPQAVTFEDLLRVFWEGHDPTQGMRQGNDVGTQYRSAIYTTTEEQFVQAEASRVNYGKALAAAGHGRITTEIRGDADGPGAFGGALLGGAIPFFYAEPDHQQYLHKVPNGYCGHGETGVSCPVGLVAAG